MLHIIAWIGLIGLLFAPVIISIFPSSMKNNKWVRQFVENMGNFELTKKDDK